MRLPNGYGSVTKLTGKRRRPWIVRVTDEFLWDEENQKEYQKRRTLGYYRTRKEALEALARYNTNPLEFNNAKTDFNTIFEVLMTEKAKNVTPERIGVLRSAWRRVEKIHNIPIKDINLSGLEKTMSEVESDFTRNICKTILVWVYDWAIAHDICNKNYASLIKATVPASKEKSVFSDSEIKVIARESKSDSMAATIYLLICTGMRSGELLKLSKEQINKNNWTIRGGSKTAAGRDRLIPIPSPVRGCIDRVDYKKKKTTFVYQFSGFCKKHGMDHTPHETRHTFATLCRRANIDPLARKKIMGHAVQDITDGIYTHMSDDFLCSESEKLTPLINKITGDNPRNLLRAK